MKNAPLTARYRPQSFAEVAGQQTIKAILSRAAAEDKVAPAYLFSGTRGVGKTTIARIFAKALNCRKAPAAEPCNECDLCRAVTQGAAIDVVEIDGASNRGIDDVRRLKEVVGYAPMDGRYKVFIIDEAHMLSRDAFNALLKTLEEPPAGVTFIMATTEPHKFPATVVSRCQHFVFKRLSEQELVDHLTHVLTQESMDFEPQAVRLIARRGAGSVRDSMSLLGQVLALGADSLTQETTRTVLGLAGQETFMALLEAIRQGNTLELVQSLRVFLEQGLDIGFFLRELANCWREMFILRQAGEAGLVAVDMPENEAVLMLALSQKFSLPHVHACWQMTLEGQRRVQSSLEPGLALELLLLNLAMLPQLMPLDALSSLARRAHVPSASKASSGHTPSGNTADGSGELSEAGGSPRGEQRAAVGELSHAAADIHTAGIRSADTHDSVGCSQESLNPVAHHAENSQPAAADEIQAVEKGEANDGNAVTQASNAPDGSGRDNSRDNGRDNGREDNRENDRESDRQSNWQNDRQSNWGATDGGADDAVYSADEMIDGNKGAAGVAKPALENGTEVDSPTEPEEILAGSLAGEPVGRAGKTAGGKAGEKTAEEPSKKASEESAKKIGEASKGETNDEPDDEAGDEPDDEAEALAPAKVSSFLPVWGDVIARAQEREGLPWFGGLVQSLAGTWEGKELVLKADSDFIATKIMEPTTRQHLEALLESMMGVVPPMRIEVVKEAAFDKDSIKEAVYENAAFKDLEEILSARLIDFGRIHK